MWVCVPVQSHGRVQFSATLQIVACQLPLSMGFPWEEYWSGLPFPSLEDLPDQGIEPMYPVLASGFFTTEPPAKPHISLWSSTY